VEESWSYRRCCAADTKGCDENTPPVRECRTGPQRSPGNPSIKLNLRRNSATKIAAFEETPRPRGREGPIDPLVAGEARTDVDWVCRQRPAVRATISAADPGPASKMMRGVGDSGSSTGDLFCSRPRALATPAHRRRGTGSRTCVAIAPCCIANNVQYQQVRSRSDLQRVRRQHTHNDWRGDSKKRSADY